MLPFKDGARQPGSGSTCGRCRGRWSCQRGGGGRVGEGDGDVGEGEDEGRVGVEELDVVDGVAGGEEGGHRRRGREVVYVHAVVHADGEIPRGSLASNWP